MQGDFFLKINKRACTSIRHTRVPMVLLHRWMIPGNREHSHSGTVTVEKQQICKIEAALNYIIDQLTPTNIILTKKNWLSYKWCRRLVEKVTARNKYTVSLLLQMFQA